MERPSEKKLERLLISTRDEICMYTFRFVHVRKIEKNYEELNSSRFVAQYVLTQQTEQVLA
jgi:hypothetical protein